MINLLGNSIVHHRVLLAIVIDVTKLDLTALQCSHLCHQKECTSIKHICLEPSNWNISRNGCDSLNCVHHPKCLRPGPNFEKKRVAFHPSYLSRFMKSDFEKHSADITGLGIALGELESPSLSLPWIGTLKNCSVPKNCLQHKTIPVTSIPLMARLR